MHIASKAPAPIAANCFYCKVERTSLTVAPHTHITYLTSYIDSTAEVEIVQAEVSPLLLHFPYHFQRHPALPFPCNRTCNHQLLAVITRAFA